MKGINEKINLVREFLGKGKIGLKEAQELLKLDENNAKLLFESEDRVRTVFVTGGAGFIGSNFILYWMRKYPNDKIINFDRLTYAGNLENLKIVENNPNYKFVKGDIAEESDIENVFKKEKIDLIVHFAAESHVDRSILGPDEFIRTNINGTHNLLKMAKKHGNIRFHHVSTDEVFGELKEGEKPFNENTPYDPRSPYSASKASSDHLVRAYHETYGLPVTISNCSNNYGPRMFPEKLFPLFITNLLENKKVPVYGQGLQKRDWIHVLDHNRGVEMIINKGKIGETYCLGGGNELANIEVTKLILKLMGKDESYIEYVTDRAGHDFRYAIDYTKAQQELGWEPRVPFEKGLSKMIEWYIENEDWWRRIKSGEYQEYYKKQYKDR